MARMDITNKLDDNDLNAHQNNYKELYAGLNTATATKKLLDDFLSGSGVVSRSMIADGSISNSKLADRVVTNSKIGDLAIDGRTIYPNAITPSKIADSAIGSRHLLDTVVSRSKLSSKFLFNGRIENNKSINTVFDDGTYIITAGNPGTFPDDADPSHNWVMSVEAINNVWVYQTLFRLELPNLKYTRVILTTSNTIYRWHKNMVGESSVQTDNLQDESVERLKLSKNFLYTKRIENDEPIENIVNDGTYIITAGNSGVFPEGETNNLNWALKIEVVNTNWVYQTLFRLEQPHIRYARVINNLSKVVYSWNKFTFGNSGESGTNSDRPHKKVLMIGNSFSLNATQFVPQMSAEQNVDVTIGILYRSGESLENHLINAQSNDAIYTYYERTSINGVTNLTTHTNVTFSQALEKNEWEYVTFQQRSSDSNKYETYQPFLTDLKSFVTANLTQPVNYGALQTWALSATVNPNQQEAYTAIVGAYRQAMIDSDLSFILPAGTAIQNARSIAEINAIDNELTEDGSHLSDLGKYIASASVFESLFRGHGSVEQIQFKPVTVNNYQRYVASKVSGNSVDYPEKITEL